jgi:predicted dienelactone hydrolase
LITRSAYVFEMLTASLGKRPLFKVGLGVIFSFLVSECWRPAHAIERLNLYFPLLEINVTIDIRELRDPDALMAGNSDLAELERATDGAIGKRLRDVFLRPLPLNLRAMGEQSVGSPLLDQALLMVSALGEVDGLPDRVDSQRFAATTARARADGTLSLLDFLEAVPGKELTVDLGRFRLVINRLRRQQRQGQELVTALPAAGSLPRLRDSGPMAIRRVNFNVAALHRSQPLDVVAVLPEQRANQRLVVISHGLWDGPESFEGWAYHLASHGYTVLLPVHPGSDKQQQRATFAGELPPPSPEELQLRPLDISAVITAAADGVPSLPGPVKTTDVVVLGHSWGATTVLQLLGATPSDQKLRTQCDDPRHPNRNLSWILQCSFLRSADRAGGTDERIMAGVAVSPPMRLLFDRSAGEAMEGTLLLISGTHDWVVPSGPEALVPMARLITTLGGRHHLVLVDGGDHFNLRSRFEDQGGVLRGLLLAWVEQAFRDAADGRAATPDKGLMPPQGWGDDRLRLVDVTSALDQVDTD